MLHSIFATFIHMFNEIYFSFHVLFFLCTLSLKCFVFSRDGAKMSKRKKNYPDPLTIVNKYGADALRYDLKHLHLSHHHNHLLRLMTTS